MTNFITGALYQQFLNPWIHLNTREITHYMQADVIRKSIQHRSHTFID